MSDKNYLSALDVADRLEAITPAPKAGCARWHALMVALTDLRATPDLSDDAIRSVLKILLNTRGGARWFEGLNSLIIDLTKEEAKQKELDSLLNDDLTDIRKVALGAEVQLATWSAPEHVTTLNFANSLISFNTPKKRISPEVWRRYKGHVVNFPAPDVVKAFLDLKSGDKVDLGPAYRNTYEVVGSHPILPFAKYVAKETSGKARQVFSVYQYAQVLAELSKKAEEQIEPARTPDAAIRAEAFEQDFDSINPGDTVMTTKDFERPSSWHVNEPYIVRSRHRNVLRTTNGRAINRGSFTRLGGIIVARADHKETPSASEPKPGAPNAFMNLYLHDEFRLFGDDDLFQVMSVHDSLPINPHNRQVFAQNQRTATMRCFTLTPWMYDRGVIVTKATGPDMPEILRVQSEFLQESIFMSLDVGSKIAMEDGKKLLVVTGLVDSKPASKEGRVLVCAGLDGSGPWMVPWGLWLSNYGRKITEAEEQPVQMGAQPPISLEGAITYGIDLARPTTLLPTYKDVWSFIDRMARAEPQEPSAKLKAFRFQMRALLREHITSDEALSPLHAVVLTEVATYYLNEHRSWIKQEGRCRDQGNRLLGFYASGLIAALEAIPDQGKISTGRLGLSINYLDKLYEAEQIKPEGL